MPVIKTTKLFLLATLAYAARVAFMSASVFRPDSERDDNDEFVMKKQAGGTNFLTTPTTNDDYPTEFIPVHLLSIQRSDFFSGSWWQSVERFLQSNASNINVLESDVFVPVFQAGKGREDIRMTIDYLDFSVEHLSKWWKLADIERDAAQHLDRYILRNFNTSIDNAMETTIAVIPFCVSNESKSETRDVWHASLLATMLSIMKHGVARIVVVGHYEMDELIVSSVFSKLTNERVVPSKHFETKFRSTELAYVHTSQVKASGITYAYSAVNVPRGALVGLQAALRGESTESEHYLGRNPQRFQYVFLTESDQILQARISKRYFAEMDHRRVVIPHRLQPMPHASDATAYHIEFKTKNLPPSLATWSLDPDKDSCCDAGNFHLGLERRTCQNFWWTCGFDDGNFEHLQGYEFMRLKSGTGLALVAGTEHSRRCIIQLNRRGCPVPGAAIAINQNARGTRR